MSSPVELIKERLGIAEVVGSYLRLEKAGANLKAACPFHNEKTPSFFVSPARGSYYCFGCGAKGDILSFVQAYEGLDFMGALKNLALKAGVEITPEDPKVKSARERMFLLLETATLFFQNQLESNGKAKEYLKGRGVTNETSESWRVGFAEDKWRNCFDYCIEKGFSSEEIERVGLVKSDKGKTYDRFRSRIIFPIFDVSGRVVAFSGRYLGKQTDTIPKYLNSPETPVFSKSRILYGFDRAKNEIRRMDYAILVEGQMDLLMCHQGGFKNAVASSGTSFTEEQVTILKRLSKRLLMVFDADKAGIDASVRSASLALSQGMEVKVTALPEGQDPAELIISDIKKFKDALRKSQHIIDFYLEAIVKTEHDERALLRAVREKLFPYVSALESSIERDHFIKRISDRTKVREEAIREDLLKTNKLETVSKGEGFQKKTALSPRKNLVERLLVGLWLWQGKEKKPLFDTMTFQKEIKRILGKEQGERIFSEAVGIDEELIYQAEAYYGGQTSLEEAVKDLLSALEEDTLRENLSSAILELAEAEKGDDQKVKQKLRKYCQEITHRLNTVREAR